MSLALEEERAMVVHRLEQAKLVQEAADMDHETRQKFFRQKIICRCDTCKIYFENTDNDDKDPGPCRIRRNNGRLLLTLFVQAHVHFMLQCLYDQLWAAEESLSQSSEPPSLRASEFGVGPGVSESSASPDTPAPARAWCRHLYQGEHDQRQAPLGTLFGPVGERPLHVCFLSANRFPDVDFLKARTASLMYNIRIYRWMDWMNSTSSRTAPPGAATPSLLASLFAPTGRIGSAPRTTPREPRKAPWSGRREAVRKGLPGSVLSP